MALTGTSFISEVESLAKQAGDKYVYGGTTSAGYDCSGLVYAALLKLGYSDPPRTSEAQYQWIQSTGNTVTKDQLQPGDLVWAQFPGDNASPGHVGIYIGNGDVFSAQDPSLGIGVASLASWGSNIVGYGRVPNETTSADATTDASLTGSVFTWPSDITGFFKDSKTMVDASLWMFNPSSWLRIGSFFLGSIILLMALYAFTRAASGKPLVPQSVKNAGKSAGKDAAEAGIAAAFLA
jgi:NlpC/P60 family